MLLHFSELKNYPSFLELICLLNQNFQQITLNFCLYQINFVILFLKLATLQLLLFRFQSIEAKNSHFCNTYFSSMFANIKDIRKFDKKLTFDFYPKIFSYRDLKFKKKAKKTRCQIRKFSSKINSWGLSLRGHFIRCLANSQIWKAKCRSYWIFSPIPAISNIRTNP